jgi:GTP-binding protein
MVLVLDARRVPNNDDLTMIDFARSAHLPVIAACVKCDKLSYSQQLKSIKQICDTLDISKSSAYPASNLNRTGIDELREAIFRMAGLE